jgi:hypothetical protein
MSKRERKREEHTRPSSTSVRYFQLYEAMSAGGSARAYPARYNGSTWVRMGEEVTAEEADSLRLVYDRKDGEGAAEDDFVQCVWMAGSRRWELCGSSSGGRFRGITDEALDKGDTATVSRYDAGTTNDSGENDEVTNELVDIGTGIVV